MRAERVMEQRDHAPLISNLPPRCHGHRRRCPHRRARVGSLAPPQRPA
jgi:hypothetical protein